MFAGASSTLIALGPLFGFAAIAIPLVLAGLSADWIARRVYHRFR